MCFSKRESFRSIVKHLFSAIIDTASISWSYLAKIESPTRAFGVSMETLFAIADTLGIPVAKLFEE